MITATELFACITQDYVIHKRNFTQKKYDFSGTYTINKADEDLLSFVTMF